MRGLLDPLVRPFRNLAAERRTVRENARALAEAVARSQQTKLAAGTDEPPTVACSFERPTVCRAEHHGDPWFGYWCRRLGLEPTWHRKWWEHAFICHRLHRRGLLRPGVRALGFGVGGEPLVPFFAACGVEIVATDLGHEDAKERGWASAKQLQDLNSWGTCPPEVFEQRVQLRRVDMNAIPSELAGFDFCWSACAFEHLGTIEHGLRFVEESLRTLKPGGLAVHTTEFNLSSNDQTIESGDTVLFRRKDLEDLHGRLVSAGHRAELPSFDAGATPFDRYVDLPPYSQEPHLRLLIESYSCTSVGIAAERGV